MLLFNYSVKDSPTNPLLGRWKHQHYNYTGDKKAKGITYPQYFFHTAGVIGKDNLGLKKKKEMFSQVLDAKFNHTGEQLTSNCLYLKTAVSMLAAYQIFQFKST